MVKWVMASSRSDVSSTHMCMIGWRTESVVDAMWRTPVKQLVPAPPPEGDVSFELAVEDGGHCKERIGAKMLVIYFGSIALAPGVWAHSS